MDRRGLLKALLGATVAPLLGPKAAAQALGVSLATNAAPILDVVSGSDHIEAGMPNPIGGRPWWGSPMQIAFDARRAARYEQNGRYAHFKSWGPAFREAVIAREELAMQLMQRKCEAEAGFYGKVVKAFGIEDA